MAAALPFQAAWCSGVPPYLACARCGNRPGAPRWPPRGLSGPPRAAGSGSGPSWSSAPWDRRRRPGAWPFWAAACRARWSIGTASQKRLDGRRTAELGRPVQRGLAAILVLRVGIGAGGQKCIDGLRAAAPGRPVQRGYAMLVRRDRRRRQGIRAPVRHPRATRMPRQSLHGSAPPKPEARSRPTWPPRGWHSLARRSRFD